MRKTTHNFWLKAMFVFVVLNIITTIWFESLWIYSMIGWGLVTIIFFFNLMVDMRVLERESRKLDREIEEAKVKRFLSNLADDVIKDIEKARKNPDEVHVKIGGESPYELFIDGKKMKTTKKIKEVLIKKKKEDKK